MKPLLRPRQQLFSHLAKQPHLQTTQRRTFLPSLSSIPLPTPPIQRLTATRTLPHQPSALYELIADVPSYSAFLPYCLSSTVTRWSGKDGVPGWGRKWPDEAELEVGWGGIREKFRSRIFCVPGKVVEAVGGRSSTLLGEGEIGHHDRNSAGGAAGEKEGEGILTHLLTRWTVAGEGEGHARVTLGIEYQFANPLYSAMSGAVADRVAGVMIEAFERRAREVLGR